MLKWTLIVGVGAAHHLGAGAKLEIAMLSDRDCADCEQPDAQWVPGADRYLCAGCLALEAAAREENDAQIRRTERSRELPQ